MKKYLYIMLTLFVSLQLTSIVIANAQESTVSREVASKKKAKAQKKNKKMPKNKTSKKGTRAVKKNKKNTSKAHQVKKMRSHAPKEGAPSANDMAPGQAQVPQAEGDDLPMPTVQND